MKLDLQHTYYYSSSYLWCEGRELSPWTRRTVRPVMTNGQAVGRGGDMCLCFQPSLLRLISAPAATVGAPVPHSPQHPGLDQSTMWLRPGARRARDRHTGGRGQRCEERPAKWLTFLIILFLIQYAKFGGWRYSSKHFFFGILKASLKTLLITHELWGAMWGQDNEHPPLSPRFVLFKLGWTIPSKMLTDRWWALYPKAISHTDIFLFPTDTPKSAEHIAVFFFSVFHRSCGIISTCRQITPQSPHSVSFYSPSPKKCVLFASKMK